MHPITTQAISLILQGFKLTAIAVILFSIILFFAQRLLLFPAPREPLPKPLPEGVTRIDMPPTFGLFLNAATQPDDRRPLIVFTHGNAECAHHGIDRFRYYQQRGVSVLLLEFPGYSEAAGSPNYDSIRNAVLAAYDTMSQRDDIHPEQIIAYGRSIGGGAAAILAQERSVQALILESSFAALKDLVYHHRYPGFLLRDRFDNLKIVAQLDKPVLLLHGRHDTLIPIRFAEQLRDAAQQVTFHTLDCEHNNCPTPFPEVTAFLQQHTTLRFTDPHTP